MFKTYLLPCRAGVETATNTNTDNRNNQTRNNLQCNWLGLYWTEQTQ